MPLNRSIRFGNRTYKLRDEKTRKDHALRSAKEFREKGNQARVRRAPRKGPYGVYVN